MRVPFAVAALLSITGPARAQLDESYAASEPAPVQPSSTAPMTKPPAPEPPALPRTMHYYPDRPIPSGYHVETRRRVGLIVTGSILAALGGAIAAGSLYDLTRGTSEELSGLGIAVGGALLLPGLSLAAIGIAARDKVLVRDEARILVVPTVAKQTIGGALSLSF